MTAHPSLNLNRGTRRQAGEQIRNPKSEIRNFEEVDYDELLEPIRFRFALDRRSFVQIVGGGVLITAIGTPVFAQQRKGGGRGRGGAPTPISARIRLGDDGTITVFRKSGWRTGRAR